MKEIVKTNKIPSTLLPFSQAVKSGQFIFVSGMTGEGKDIKKQTRATINKIKVILEAAGASLDDVVRTTVFLSDGKDFDKMNEVYKEFFPKDYPARTTVQARSAREKFLVQIDAIAMIPRK